MAELNTKPFSSSKRQHQTLVIAGRRQGLELSEIRKFVGGSLRRLPAKQCSDFIERFSGRGLANPPGQKPGPYAGKKRTPGATRMITADQVDQIERLSWGYFPDSTAFITWLAKTFKVPHVQVTNLDETRAAIRQLATSKRAGEVIRVLKTMIARRKPK